MGSEIEPGWRVETGAVEEYWSWTAGALYLLLTLDLLTTIYAAGLYGRAAEANPFVRRALAAGVPSLVVLNLLALLAVSALVYGYIELLTAVRGVRAWVMARSFELWIGGLVAVGLFTFANNLSVIVLGGSLV